MCFYLFSLVFFLQGIHHNQEIRCECALCSLCLLSSNLLSCNRNFIVTINMPNSDSYRNQEKYSSWIIHKSVQVTEVCSLLAVFSSFHRTTAAVQRDDWQSFFSWCLPKRALKASIWGDETKEFEGRKSETCSSRQWEGLAGLKPVSKWMQHSSVHQTIPRV